MKQNTSLFSQMLLWQKFLILGLLAIILVAFPFSLYYTQTKKGIEVAEHEAQGITPSVTILKLVQLTQRHRGLSTLFLTNAEDVAARLGGIEKDMEQTIADMDKLVKQGIKDEAISGKWVGIVQAWQTLKPKVAAKQLDSAESIKQHSQLIADMLVTLDKIADHFGLSLETEAGPHFLIDAALYGIPQVAENLGKLRAMGSGALKEKAIMADEKFRITSLIENADNNLQIRVLGNINKAFAELPDVKAKLDPELKESLKKYQAAIGLTQKEVINAAKLGFPYQDYFTTYTAVIDSQFDLNKHTLELLDGILTQRVKNLRSTQSTLSLGLLALFVLAALAAYYISRSISKPVGSLVEVMNKLAAGDTKIRANPQGTDEISALGRQFDMMVDQRELINAKIQQENESLNNSIIELLYTVAKLAQKDLTAKATVAEDVTGSVADALNVLADETAKVLGKVVQIAKSVSEASQRVQTQSSAVILIAEEEKNEVELAANELNAASKAMLDIALLAFSCNEAAANAIKNTDKAQETVLGTVHGITTIRDTIRETEKRIKRLGERSQEIGGVVNLIHDIAERTHILALNASMHAASAGEAGRGFAVVANEVQKLAENSREATSKISALVNNIQVETADTITTMNEAISQVVTETGLAQQAGDDMRKTRETTATLVDLVQRIADSSTVQSENSQRLVMRAKQIQKSTDHTYGQLQDQGAQTELLVNLSNMLVSAVGVFTLPKETS